jgi:hypothetical protein
MNLSVVDRVLHMMITDSRKCEKELKTIYEISSVYEGDVKGRIGFNFPLKTVDFKKYKLFEPYGSLVDYVIVYKKGDILTKKHELLHAKYFIDSEYRKEVNELWGSFSDSYRKNVLNMLKKMNYPDDHSILLDEFQAYYFSEQPNFFGKQN